MITVTVKQMKKNAERGVRWLNKVRPEWKDDVNVHGLNMRMCGQCVIGQLVGNDNYSMVMTQKQRINMGFELPAQNDGSLKSMRYRILTKIWKRIIVRERGE